MNIYVSQFGSDIDGDGTELNPFETIQKALNEFKKLEGIKFLFYLIFWESNLINHNQKENLSL